jgi:GNAT superfamily N-acetyltransferase
VTAGASVHSAPVVTRAYLPGDEPAILELLQASLGAGPGGARSADFFRWKHVENPFGPSFMLLAEAEDRIVGLRAFMRWGFEAGGAALPAVRAVDTATHPDHQGRGIFSRLTREAVDALRADTAFVFNTPNGKSLPGYLKMGWRTVGRIPVGVRVRRPVRFLVERGGRRTADTDVRPSMAVDAASAGEVLDRTPGLADLVASSEPATWAGRGRIATLRTLPYLRWRYGRAPLLDYRALVEERGPEVRGIAIFRVRPRGSLTEATVAEVITRAGDGATAARLLRRIGRTAPVDHVTCSFPSGTVLRAASRRTGYVRTPGGLMLVANTLRDHVDPDPGDERSWALSLGDLEVF